MQAARTVSQIALHPTTDEARAVLDTLERLGAMDPEQLDAERDAVESDGLTARVRRHHPGSRSR